LFIVGLVLFAAARGADANLSTSDLQGAEKVMGLEFTDAERAMAAPDVNRRLKAFEALRQESFPNELAPAFVFNPLPMGFQVEGETRKNRPVWKPVKNVKRPASDEDLAFLSVSELSGLIAARQISSEELTRFFLERLRKYGPTLRCVVTLTEERALAEARRADADLKAGKWRGPLHGIPYAAKDLLDTQGIATTWGVSLYTNRIPDADATVIRKLSEAGAVLIAKTSLGELAMGDTWFGGLTRNPWAPEKGSSGSSAGSASAVAAGLVPFAIGSETMGSIVSPATVCGVTGLRPTYGRVSRAGAMTLAWTHDKLGPLARTAFDCALVLDAMRGADPRDPSTRDAAFRFTEQKPFAKMRVGYIKREFEKAEGNQTNDLKTLELLRGLGVQLREVEWPKISRDALWLTLDAEWAAAFDELTRSNLDDRLVQQGPNAWPNEFRAGRYIPAVEYIQAMRLRARLIEEMAKLFSEVDVIVAPPFRGNSIFYSNVAGYPCVVVPNGVKMGGNLASITFIGKLYGEADALRLAEGFQASTSFHQQRPPLP
jgi:Asp-tRNA(Asn)/Glu-tRNA(Gln) amidotransferase A subunit family amidase